MKKSFVYQMKNKIKFIRIKTSNRLGHPNTVHWRAEMNERRTRNPKVGCLCMYFRKSRLPRHVLQKESATSVCPSEKVGYLGMYVFQKESAASVCPLESVGCQGMSFKGIPSPYLSGIILLKVSLKTNKSNAE
ncbi:hypothetical protein CHS0354_034276 [Potamilus streckersoni]|uniref:Uncharacterized protein n=1 Tax=Potamilus streckersoni TaxID=2493646 RepID=A0AAE0S4H1_9BIVA|nr:hypothetical protein CHS0354_034276 [Potamilus streckersoni]